MSKKKTFGQLIKSEAQPVLVDFYADWCGPCKVLSPILQQVARDLSGKIKVIKVNVDKNQAAATNYQVRSVPTIILFHRGKILWRNSGVIQKHDLISQLNYYLSGSKL